MISSQKFPHPGNNRYKKADVMLEYLHVDGVILTTASLHPFKSQKNEKKIYESIFMHSFSLSSWRTLPHSLGFFK